MNACELYRNNGDGTPQGTRQICRTVSSGGSFGCNPLRQEIGLGNAAAIDSIEVFWPVTAETQVFKHPIMDRFYGIREGSSEMTPLNLKSFKFPASHTEHQHHS